MYETNSCCLVQTALLTWHFELKTEQFHGNLGNSIHFQTQHAGWNLSGETLTVALLKGVCNVTVHTAKVSDWYSSSQH